MISMKSPLATCLSHLRSYRQHYILKSEESMPCFPEVQIRADVQTTCGFLMTTCLLQVTHYVSEFPPPQSLILKECVYSQGTNFKYRKAKTMKVKCHMRNYTNSDRNSFQMIYTMDYSILHGILRFDMPLFLIQNVMCNQQTFILWQNMFHQHCVYSSLLLMLVIQIIDLY